MPRKLFALIFALTLAACSTAVPTKYGGIITPSGGGGGAPTGAASGALAGTYPGPTLKAPYSATTYTVHGVLLGEAGSNIAAMAACAAGSVIYGQGAADPVCSTLILPNAATTGDLLAATSTNTVGSIADVAVNQVLTSGGVGVIPAYSGTPTFTATNLTGSPLFTNINKVNALGAIASAGTATCDLSLGAICTFSGSSGTVNIAIPSNGAQNVQYLLIATATGTFSTSFNTATPGWRQWNYATLATTNPPDGNAVTNGNTMMIPFHYDGTNYVLDGWGELSANRIKANVLTASTINGSPPITAAAITGTTGSFTSTFALTGGGPFSTTGGTSPTATCSGGSTGVVVSAGNSTCTANVTPFPCCTGNTTGTCSNSTDNRGLIQTSSSASTNCTVTFNHTWPQAPICIVGDGSASITPTSVSAGASTTTTLVIDFASATTKDFVYFCS